MPLYQVDFPAVPLPAHPRYWEIGGALLEVYLLAESADAALAEAENVLRLLKWEAVPTPPGRPVLVIALRWPQPHGTIDTEVLKLVEAARAGELAVRVVQWPVGTDTDLPDEAPPVA